MQRLIEKPTQASIAPIAGREVLVGQKPSVSKFPAQVKQSTVSCLQELRALQQRAHKNMNLVVVIAICYIVLAMSWQFRNWETLPPLPRIILPMLVAWLAMLSATATVDWLLPFIQRLKTKR